MIDVGELLRRRADVLGDKRESWAAMESDADFSEVLSALTDGEVRQLIELSASLSQLKLALKNILEHLSQQAQFDLKEIMQSLPGRPGDLP